MRTAHAAALWVLLALWIACAQAADYVWWEAETPLATNFKEKTWFSASTFEATRHEVLSGGDWMTNDGPRGADEAFARYRVTTPAAGAYHLWARKFWKHGPFRWRFDDHPWRVCGRDVALADNVEIRKFVCVNWVCLGKVDLDAGEHVFDLRLLAAEGEKLTACFDCFLLTPHAFMPRGRLRPDEKSGRAAPGFWAFEPEPDLFADATLDLRPMNEKAAGEAGFVRRQDDRFVLGDGRPARFWGVNVGAEVVRLEPDLQTYVARRLAKTGVNLVRIHGPVFDAASPDPTKPDAEYLRRLFSLVGALKAQGIYTLLSFYFPLWFDVKDTYGIPGYDSIENRKPFALLFFDRRMQEIHRSWARALLRTPRKDGPLLAEEPAVAMVEVVNEDSFLFWTFSRRNVPAVHWRRLEQTFAAWLVGRYGDLDKACAAWGGPALPEDRPFEGAMSLLDVWNLTGRGSAGRKRPRMSDQLRFLVETQRRFYEDTVRFLRADLGVRSLIVCGNWKTADAATLDSLERYTYMAGDVIDRHGYFQGRHEGPRSKFAVDAGDTFADRAGVLEPEALPLSVNQVQGWPHVISETGWPSPNRFQAEFPFLAAAAGSLQGLDGLFLFAVGGPGWDASPRKFPVSTPSIMGQFPGCSLLYRRGDLREAEVVFCETLTLKDLYAFKGSVLAEPQGLDELRRDGVNADAAERPSSGLDPLAFWVGRVERAFADDPATAVRRDLGPFVDRKARTVRSVTGELAWDYGRGVVTVNSERAQGAAGFLGRAGRIELRDVAIECRTEFASILVVSLDEAPLAAPRHVLVQAATEDQPWGWRVEGGRIASLGGYPLNVHRIEATVSLKRPTPGRAGVVLDPHGYRRAAATVQSDAGGLRLALPPDALYTVLE